MANYHVYEMSLMIEELLDQGFVKIDWAKIYRWFGKERLTQKDYQELYSSIEEVSGQKGIAIRALSNYGSVNIGYIVLFVDSRTQNFKDYF